jgi:hypothetical protein
LWTGLFGLTEQPYLSTNLGHNPFRLVIVIVFYGKGNYRGMFLVIYIFEDCPKIRGLGIN